MFKVQLNNWLNFCDINDDDKKIRLAIKHMKEGEVAEWVVQKAAEDYGWMSYNQFAQEIEERFRDVDPKYTACEKLKKLCKGSLVEKLNTNFKKYMVHCNYSEMVLIKKYQDCLNNKTLKKFYQRELPETLQTWMHYALQYKQLTLKLRAWKNKRVYTPPTATRNTLTTGQSGQRASSTDYKPGTMGPMDIDSARRLGKCRHCGMDWAIGHSCEQ